MRIKLDENIPFRLVDILNQMGHETDSVPQEGLSGENDKLIWKTAQEANRFLITQDLDFSDIREFAPGTHCGLLLIRLYNPGRDAIVEKIQMIFQTEKVESWQGCFVVATDHKIRVRCPKI
jgi:predicted nuclease of predicted toxin-antitoxin system